MIRRPTILVVEDSPLTRKMLRLALVTEGYTVIEAEDAHSALAAAAQTLPDLVLQDLILPDMDGLELLLRLRTLPGGAELPILALSGFLSRLEAALGHAGFTALLVKPIEPNRLLDAIRVYLPQPPAHETPVGGQRTVLAVDDDPVQLKLTRIRLSQLGFAVRTAASASDALAAARASRPDVILSDVFMPGRDGFDLCVDVRGDPGLARVPVVLLSAAYGSGSDQDLARRVGANALIVRTPGFENVAPAILHACNVGAPPPTAPPNDQFALTHARLVIHQLERQAVSTAGLAQRCGIQAGQLSLLSGVANALTRRMNPDTALRDVLAATLDAAGISKGALLLRGPDGALQLRHEVGFPEAERIHLQNFFGHVATLEGMVDRGSSVSLPSTTLPGDMSRDVLVGANVGAAQIVPLMSDGCGMGVMIIGAASQSAIGDDFVAFARAMGNQVVQSLELTKAVARVRASEERYRTLLAGASDFIAVLAPDGTVREMNHRWVSLTGLSPDELIGRQLRDVALPASEDGEASPVEMVGVDGAIVFIEFSTTNIDVAGEPLVLSVGRDVTERQGAEAQVRLQSAALNAAANAMVITDRAGLIEWINPAFSELTGYSAAESVGRNPRDLIKSGRHAPTFYKHLWDTVLAGQVWRGETINRRKDCSLYTEEQTITPVRDAHGTIRHFIGVKQGITGRLRTERELHDSREEQLRLKDAFLSHVSHEFRTPVSAIKQFTSILLNGLAGELNNEQRAYQHIVLRNVQQLQAMIDEVLEVTRLATGRLPIEPQALCLLGAVYDCLALEQAGASLKGVTLACDLPANLPLVYTDGATVRRILTILVDNAINNTTTGECVTVSARTPSTDPAFVILDVSYAATADDSDAGVRMFEPFHQEAAPAHGSRAGLGLGLFVCKELVTRQGGNISFERRSDVGTLSFTVPRVPDARREPAAAR